ncbi:hypothetical protein TSTA_114340 [Talaromyces stipitatus ATCC 10500]|uniref:DUF1772-domain-containing protein n=1 Tax=Talaromyces stipitatus (strain ATCC 10500 / CBS 375.48 / QM 6759 / NRRL 1006) TaxID=441959 RepID=B8MD96_TALSN|nr:uncharacterized protein TSTA_114340 [Talaromyces stipitatus ATCC 10500]EED17621.1 hypothetical protein TSTA_114340 [Talaromyces stipitatus ATCC 10500]
MSSLQPLSSLTISSFLPPLPLLGLITSTNALVYAYSEHIFLNPLSDPNVVPAATIRHVWHKCFPSGFALVASSRIGSILSGVAGYRASETGSTAETLYAAAIAFTVVHFVFLPWTRVHLMPILDKNPTKESDEKIHERNKNFVQLDAIRTFASEIPAFLCFLGATLSYLRL